MDKSGARWNITRDTRFLWVLLAALMIGGVAVRVYRLGGESAWTDEIVSLRHLNAPSLAAFLRGLRYDDPPMVPVYFTLQYLWSCCVGSEIAHIRVLSVIFAVLCIPATFLLGKRLLDGPAGLIAAFLVSFSFMFCRYSQEIRMYSLSHLLILLSAYGLFSAIETRKPGYWALHFLANAFLLWTHLMCVFFIFVEGLFLCLFWRRNLRGMMKWGAAHLGLLVPSAVWVLFMDFDRLRSVHRSSMWGLRLAPSCFLPPCGYRSLTGGMEQPLKIRPAPVLGYLATMRPFSSCCGLSRPRQSWCF